MEHITKAHPQPELAPLPDTSPTLRDRLLQTRAGRAITGGLACIGLVAGMGINSNEAHADSSLIYPVTNTEGGVFSRNSPHTEDTPRIAGQGAYDGDQVQLLCGVTNGDAVGPYNNNTWHKVKNLSRPDQPEFWLNDRYVQSPNVADQLAPGEAECEASPTQHLQGGNITGSDLQHSAEIPDMLYPKSCYFNIRWPKKDLTFSYEGNHRYYGNAWQAAKNWTDLGAGVSITPAPEGQQGDIIIKDIYDHNAGFYGGAVIEPTREWMGPHTTPPITPKSKDHMTIEVNQYAIEDQPNERLRLNDFGRTYLMTHEMGHILGLAHPDAPNEQAGCGIDRNDIKSIMEKGTDLEAPNTKPFNTPQEYDKIALETLYR